MLGFLKKQQGFTLIELVTVMVILGVLATSVTTFIRFGTQSYTDAADREQLTSTARFVIERLNREVRNALPNSMRVISGDGKQCLEFIPIARSAIYLDIPVAPEPVRNTITLAPFASDLVSNSSRISIYGLTENTIYNNNEGVIAVFDSNNNNSISPKLEAADLNGTPPQVMLTLSAPIQFDAESPTNRLYFIEEPIAYCLEGDSLYRYNNYVRAGVDRPPIFDASIPNRHLMAELFDNTVVPFQVMNATLQRNALVIVHFEFFQNLERIIFNHEIQVPNVP
jgi:MSHA biogenesis protein MshO